MVRRSLVPQSGRPSSFFQIEGIGLLPLLAVGLGVERGLRDQVLDEENLRVGLGLCLQALAHGAASREVGLELQRFGQYPVGLVVGHPVGSGRRVRGHGLCVLGFDTRGFLPVGAIPGGLGSRAVGSGEVPAGLLLGVSELFLLATDHQVEQGLGDLVLGLEDRQVEVGLCLQAAFCHAEGTGEVGLEPCRVGPSLVHLSVAATWLLVGAGGLAAWPLARCFELFGLVVGEAASGGWGCRGVGRDDRAVLCLPLSASDLLFAVGLQGRKGLRILDVGNRRVVLGLCFQAVLFLVVVV